MDQRIVEFIRTLRAAGVRISLAESNDAMRAIEQIGIHDREVFRYAMRTALIKDGNDVESYEHFFPLFFDTAAPPMFDMEQELTPEQQQLLQQALQSLMGNPQALQQLLQQMMDGQHLSPEQLEQLAQMAGLQNADRPMQEGYYARQMQQALGLRQMQELLEQLRDALQTLGMNEDDIHELMQMMEANRQALMEQIRQYAGSGIAQNMLEKYEEREPEDQENLMETPFQYLSPEDADKLRDEVKRLVARLRSRAALRQRRANAGTPDPKTTLRNNLRYGGVPMELKFRTRHLKPRLVVICDISTSMRYCSEFMLTMIYELQDQVSRAHSFVFIDDMREITHYFKAQRPEQAVQQVLHDNPPGSYNTDLGHSLQTFFDNTLDTVDSRTTVIFVGDGRNNFKDPRLDLAHDLRRRSRRVVWFNPEPELSWGTGDSDMHRYAPISSGVYQVRNLAQLVDAIDRIMADG